MPLKVAAYIEVINLGLERDYEALEHGDGFVLPWADCPTGVIHTRIDAKIISLLEFEQAKPRGNHFHKDKEEYMTILRGRLKCEFSLPEERANILEIILEPGQQVHILSGCIHKYTATDNNVYAIEYGSQRYRAEDVIFVE
jgi:mannose-6-phosphate isomerase-like protein (cupin superfamily)